MSINAKTVLEKMGELQSSGGASGLPCPRCGRKNMDDDPVRNALSRRVNVYICDECGTLEALYDYLGNDPLPLEEWALPAGLLREKHGKSRLSPQERTRQRVMTTGNKFAIENFNATH